MGRADFLYEDFLKHFSFTPTACQNGFFKDIANFVTDGDSDILVVNGYAGTGKTSAISAVISSLTSMKVKCCLMAPTGRAAKVLSNYAKKSARTIHKTIYKQKSVGDDGFGQFSLVPNKSRDTLFIVDEVSLIGVEAGSTNQSSTLFGTGDLLHDLVTYVRSGADCRLVLIGDSAQLPPIGLDMSPALSQSFMDGFSGVCYSTLSTVVRQKKESGILFNATMLRQSGELKLSSRAFDDVERIGGGELIEKIGDAYDRYGEEETIILCRSNKRAIRYNLGVRSTVQFKEERLVKHDKLMIVKNCYQFVEDLKGMEYIANGDIAVLQSIGKYEDRYGLHFAEARLMFPDYDGQEIVAKVCLDTLESESASLTYEQQNALYMGVSADYSHIASKKKRYDAVREDKYYNALQLKYANAITCHKAQGGQWKCVFIDCPFWRDDWTVDDVKWLYTAITRASAKVYLVNFKDNIFV